jgi:hypothetical protein
VAIPKDLVDDVIDLMPKLVHADEKVKEDVQAGSSVFEAFKKHRSWRSGARETSTQLASSSASFILSTNPCGTKEHDDVEDLA